MLKEFDGRTPSFDPTSYISDTSVLIGDVSLGAGVSIWPGCVLRADVAEIVVHDGSNLQDGVLVHTNHGLPAVIGEDVTVGHGAIVHGCRIGDRCLIGMGAIILDGAVVEDECIIGAGALVTEHARIPRGSLVLGVPGKVKRQLTPEEKKKIKDSAAEYRELAQMHRE